jgi:putative copper export protein
MGDVLYEIMRWLHLASMATLIGGMLFARLVMARALESVAPDTRESLLQRVAAYYKPFVYCAIGGLVISGSYALLTTPGHRPFYHMLFGIKLLLALHVFAAAILIVQPKNPRRVRMMTGVVISGLVIIGISAWLRHIF